MTDTTPYTDMLDVARHGYMVCQVFDGDDIYTAAYDPAPIVEYAFSRDENVRAGVALSFCVSVREFMAAKRR